MWYRLHLHIGFTKGKNTHFKTPQYGPAFFSRESGSRKQISLILFETWGHSVQAHAYFIENIFMFIPFGILAPVLFKRMKKMYWCVLAGFLMSCTIEISQLLTQRGYMQIDDVLTNTAGAMAGWLIWKIVTLLTGFLKSEFT